MPFNERWRRLKIVDQPILNKEQELVGGLKNALERGETLAKAKQSFLNAGYKPMEIDAAVQKMPMTTGQVNNQVKDTRYQGPTKNLPSVKMPKQKQKLSKKFAIILIAISALILIGAAILGIFWNKLFP